MSYNSRENQFVRFEVLSRAIPDKKEALSLLDVGCGLGDLCGLLEYKRLSNITYTGIDVVPEMIINARKKHPLRTFQNIDFFDDKFQSPFDIIVSSGALNIVFDDLKKQLDYIKTAIKKMYFLSNKAAAFNLLSRKAMEDFPQDSTFYYSDPEEILAFCKKLTPRADLIEGYLPHDFTILLKK